MSSPEAVVRWYGVLLVVTAAFVPWVRLLCAALPDRGATVARPMALLGTIFPIWFLAGFGILPYSTVGLWIIIAVAGGVGWTIVIRRGRCDRAWFRTLALSEVLAIAIFLVYVWLRGFTPDIDNTEKPMDIALLAASAQTTVIPPNDPWFSGETINYYYLGYLVHGSVARLAGVPTEYGFNLALATTGSMAIVGAAGVGFNAARRWGGRRVALGVGAGAAFLLVIAGNMYAPFRLVQDPAETIDAMWWDQEVGVGWRSSRIVCDGVRIANQCEDGETINEFPSFSLLLGDLHPHVMALPFTVMALALALNLVVVRGHSDRRRSRWSLPLFGVSGALTGSLYALNSWDYPTFLLVLVVAALLATRGWERREQVTALGTLLIASIAAWTPFYLDFAAPVGSATADIPGFIRDFPLVSTLLGTLAAVRGERTSAGEFFTVFGVSYLAALWLIGTGLRSMDRLMGVVWPALAVVVVGGLIVPAPVLILCGIPLVLAVAQLWTRSEIGPRTIATALFALGFALVIGTEFFYIQDLFSDRMNTVFKVYYQAWTLLAIATAVSVVVFVQEFRSTAWMRPALTAAATVATLAGLAFPSVAYYQWTNHFADWRGLDGLAYVGTRNPDELAAINWVDRHVDRDDVVLEAAGCSYGNIYTNDVRNNRVSAFTGVPTVIGWGGHERQWRNGQVEMDEIGPRQKDVRQMYGDPQSPLFDAYGVTYLYVGSLERLGDRECAVLEEPYAGVSNPGYPGVGWELAFASGDVAVYKRIVPATAFGP